jgi:DNA-binding XRE family transcriptional regulator
MSSTSPAIDQKLKFINTGVETFAAFMSAYQECNHDSQKIVDEMVSIVASDETTADEKGHAVDVIVEALFPGLVTDIVDAVRSLNRSSKAQKLKASMARENDEFADNVAQLLRKKRIRQADLAKMIGVNQPAISMIIKRKCRPQKSTVLKIAEALQVGPEDLWPGFESD